MSDPIGSSTPTAVDPPPEEDAPSIVGTTRANLIGAACVFALGAYCVADGFRMGYWADGPGAGFFPIWMGGLMAILAVLWAGQAFRSAVKVNEEPATPADRRRMLALLVGLVVTVVLMGFVGYQLAMTGFMLFALLFLNRRGWIESTILSVASGFGVYTLFAGLLKVYLPTASLPLLAQLGL